jgi:sugar O-acyltransferase (sialic acid O-acetyltransferase NeuD family)
MSNLVIFGVSNDIGNTIDCALAIGHAVTAIVLNQPETVRPRTKSVTERIAVLEQPPQLVAFEQFEPRPGEIYFLGTSAPARAQLVDQIVARFGIRFCSLVHPTAYVSPLARVGDDVYVGARSAVQAHVVLGDHVFVGSGVTVGHDCVIEPYACLRQGSGIGGHVTVGRGATIGLGASVIHELAIGADAFVAAGAVVIRDVEAGALVAGVPAQVKRRPGA